MCRTQGRRCEHNWSESQKQADLARRRAIYSAKKHAQSAGMAELVEKMGPTPLKSTTNHVKKKTLAELMGEKKAPTPVTAVPPVEKESLTELMGGKKPDSAKVPSGNIQRRDQDCKITYKNKEYECYSKEEMFGQIDPTALNEDSYEEYGFEDASRWSKDASYDSEFGVLARASSFTELKALSNEEKIALSVFTTEGYTTINRYLHNSPRAENILNSLVSETNWVKKTPYSYDNQETVESMLDSIPEHANNPNRKESAINDQLKNYAGSLKLDYGLNASRLNGYVEACDSAFSKASGKQRITYRGEKFTGKDRFDGYGSVEEYADAKFGLGNKLAFGGMQSTTVDQRVAGSYAGSNLQGGIIYEIMSPSGISVSEVSAYGHENEVLLPRNTQYRVVGKKFVTNDQGRKLAIIQMVEVDDNDNIRTSDNMRGAGDFGAFDANKWVKKE